MEIKFFKLVTNEFVISNVKKETDEFYSLSKPMAVIRNRNQFILIPWLPMEECQLNKIHVLVEIPISHAEDLKKMYIQQTSGIVIPDIKVDLKNIEKGK
ncbi:hypothetical protein J7J62_08130 [bacterium]|nr:hypothetical protein [bacterium]